MQASNNRLCYHVPVVRQPVPVGMQRHGQWWWWLWKAGPQRHMRTALVIMHIPPNYVVEPW
jgi:hypothetical protein